MNTLLFRLYEALGLGLPEDDGALVVDDLRLYFNESEAGLEICCPFMALPDDSAILNQCLQLNYSGPVIFATDAENAALLAVIRLPADSHDDSLVAGMEQLIASVRHLNSHAGQKPTYL